MMTKLRAALAAWKDPKVVEDAVAYRALVVASLVVACERSGPQSVSAFSGELTWQERNDFGGTVGGGN